MGVISAIGNSVAENRVSLTAGKCGIGRLEMFPSKFSETRPVAEIKISNNSLKEKLDSKSGKLVQLELI